MQVVESYSHDPIHLPPLATHVLAESKIMGRKPLPIRYEGRTRAGSDDPCVDDDACSRRAYTCAATAPLHKASRPPPRVLICGCWFARYPIQQPSGRPTVGRRRRLPQSRARRVPVVLRRMCEPARACILEHITIRGMHMHDRTPRRRGR